MRREAGFTLVELLAAMVAGSLLLVSLGGAVAMLGRELVKVKSADTAQGFQSAAAVLGPLIEQASPPGPDGSGFRASGHALEAVVPPPLVAAASGPLRLTLKVVRTAEGQALLARLVPVNSRSSLPAEAQRERTLLSGYRSIRFEYALSPGDGARLPRLVTLKAVDAEGRVQHASAAPRVHSDGRCRFDPSLLTCQY